MADYLYIHIPFCIRKCIYCDFLSFIHDERAEDRYTAALCRELELRKDEAGVLKSVYIGGGTPTVLSPDNLERLFSCVRRCYIVNSDAEITVEANPGTIDQDKVALLVSHGVNRISLGVQSFEDKELRTLGRIHDSCAALEACRLIKAAGIRNLSIDLIYGIPGQSAESWGRTLQTALSLDPLHISTYELTPERHTPLHELTVRGSITMPEEDAVLGMYDQAFDLLSAAGFEHYEISNFAKPGCRCLHNMNYWDRGAYIGAGAGAHSFLKGRRSQNTEKLGKYVSMTAGAELPEAGHTDITSQEAAREYIFLGLRKTEGLGQETARSFGLDLANTCSELIEEGFLHADNRRVRLTRKGLTVSNAVIVRIFELSGL